MLKYQETAISDINECVTDNGGCQQICINIDGGHMCECHGPGFLLSEDNYTCIGKKLLFHLIYIWLTFFTAVFAILFHI